MEGEKASWRGKDKRSSPLLALAVATMAIAGFGVAGAVALGTVLASEVTHVSGSPAAAPLLAEKITPQMSALLHGYLKHSVHQSTSSNWAGYADTATGGTILEVLGEWRVPTINCDVYPAIADNWVGIDGFSDTPVEQGGTYEYCNSDGGGPYYWDWFEFYPYESSVAVNEVYAGDLIQAYVLYNPYTCEGGVCGIYSIIVEDLSHPSADILVQGNPSVCNSSGWCETGPDESAECISESLVGEGDYLADYGTTKFISCDASINGYWAGIGGLPSGAHATTYEITTYDSANLVEQKPSGLKTYDYKDDQFTITWKEYD